MSKKKANKKPAPRAKPKPKAKPAPAPPPTTALPKHLEDFAQLMHRGKHTQREAAVEVGRAPSSGKYLFHLPAVQQRIAEITKGYGNEMYAKRVGELREVNIDQNDIIMGLADIARDEGAAKGARVSAYLGLADIFMLRAKNVRDVKDFYGWTATELREFAINGTIPPRLQLLVSARESTEEGGTPSFRTDKLPGR